MSSTSRETSRPVDPLFLERWSPRAFDGSAIDKETLLTLFDAARWAPSAFNYQPWRFVYAVRDSHQWDKFLGLLIPFNASWAQNASALVFVLSDTLIDVGKGPAPSHSHSFDAGAAWALMALQATRLGLHAHGMAGVDFDRARTELSVPDQFRIEAAVAIGRMGDKSTLPQGLREQEAPSGRHPVEQFAFEGGYSG